eukprot:TRINITY_DN79810_c0_g1_i1.p1 TRINITY_DN79810_c0_g1~~TRINITY_DN79810_c0_g1_i1.p1  ORF type:complete len:244 (+),score=9.75 TRINITY_DN79810_c0_g1_i1:43-774(+)
MSLSRAGSGFLHPMEPGDPLRAVGTLLPILYVWCLPFLGKLGFAHLCTDFPRCDSTGASVSDFISNDHATGAMAALFFYPNLFLWKNALHVRDTYVYRTLGTYQASFGLFLACPVTEVPNLHGMAVCLFCITGLAHNNKMLKHCEGQTKLLCQRLLKIAMMAFVVIFLLVWVARFDENLLPDNCPYCFWISECVGLSSMIIFPLFWYRDHYFDADEGGDSWAPSLENRAQAAHSRELVQRPGS